MKTELPSNIIDLIGLKSKMYRKEIDDNKEERKQKASKIIYREFV